MAYKDSGEIATNSNYALGDYSFRIERTSVPGSTNDKIEAICTDKDGKNARKSIQVPSSAKLNGWYVEANSEVATVYVNVTEKAGFDPSVLFNVNPKSEFPYVIGSSVEGRYSGFAVTAMSSPVYVFSTSTTGENQNNFVFVSASPFSGISTYFSTETLVNADSITHEGYTYYYRHLKVWPDDEPASLVIDPVLVHANADYRTDWNAMYIIEHPEEDKTYDKIVGRFSIELEDAGGVGPDSDWSDPGDYDEDWEEGDPTHTLYVTVTGALSGRHNDPIEDSSYSYIPSDKDTVKDYGCGGDGGNGGGGGAGASSIVVYKFATDQANSKEIDCKPKRHGYGSGGGKGGKGGDGCILVYY